MTDQIQGYRLSPVQRRAWSLASSDGSLPRVSATVEVGGPLDLDRLRGALAAVIERHEILRTSFAVVEGEPVQQVHPAQPLPLARQDLLRGRSAAELDDRFDRHGTVSLHPGGGPAVDLGHSVVESGAL